MPNFLITFLKTISQLILIYAAWYADQAMVKQIKSEKKRHLLIFGLLAFAFLLTNYAESYYENYLTEQNAQKLVPVLDYTSRRLYGHEFYPDEVYEIKIRNSGQVPLENIKIVAGWQGYILDTSAREGGILGLEPYEGECLQSNHSTPPMVPVSCQLTDLGPGYEVVLRIFGRRINPFPEDYPYFDINAKGVDGTYWTYYFYRNKFHPNESMWE